MSNICDEIASNQNSQIRLHIQLFLPVYLALLHDHFVGFLSHDATMEPHLCPVYHWKTDTFDSVFEHFFDQLWTRQKQTPEIHTGTLFTFQHATLVIPNQIIGQTLLNAVYNKFSIILLFKA